MEAWRPRPGPSQDEASGVDKASSAFTMAVKRASAFFAIVLGAGVLCSAPLELKVVGDHVNLRARPVFDAEIAGQVSSGVTLTAPDGMAEGAEWVKVRPPQSVDLWIFSALVDDDVVTADDTYVRCGPGYQYRPVGKVGKGFRVEPRGAASGDWLRIAPVPTAELYISSRYVLAVPQVATGGTGNGKRETEVQISDGKSQISSPFPEMPKAENPKNEPADQRANAPTNQHEIVKTNRLANAPTNQLENVQTNQLANSPTLQRINEQTNKRTHEQKVAPPAILAGNTLAPIPMQGEVVTLHGRLVRLSLAKALSFSRYQLVDKAGFPRSTVICHVVGLQGQWHELAESEIEIEGRLWTLIDSFSRVIPVIDASRVRRIASWEK